MILLDQNINSIYKFLIVKIMLKVFTNGCHCDCVNIIHVLEIGYLYIVYQLHVSIY